MTKKIAIIVGSLRKDSYNRKLALVLKKLAAPELNMNIIEIGNLPLYDQDPDDQNNPPDAWVKFREEMKKQDGFLFVTPEYNRSIPAPLKNAIDVGSRPYGQSIWEGKPAAIISASLGAIGGFGANQHLRQTFVFLNIFCMQAPEAYIASVQTLFDESGNINNENTLSFLKNFVESFKKWVDRF